MKNSYSSDNIVKHFIVYGFGVILINSASYFLIPIYTRYLLTSEFGILEILNRCIEISNIIFAAGLGITSLSFYSGEKEPSKKNTVISTAILSLFVFSLIGAILFLTLAPGLNSYFFGSHKYLLLFRMASIILLAEMLSIVPMAYLQARMKSKLYVAISVLRFTSIVGLNIITVIFLSMRIKGVVLANLIGSAFFALILLTYTLSKTGLRFDINLFKKMLSFGLPFIPGGLFLFVLNNGDRFFIQTMLDSSILGIYSLGYKIGTLVMIFVLGPFLKVWGPYLFELDRDSEAHKSFSKFFLYLTLAYCIAALALAVFSKEILRLLSDKSYWEGYKVVPYILVAYLFWAMAAFFDSGFYITRKTFYKPFIMGTATILIFILYWILIPTYGLLGGAYATVLGFGAFSLMTFFVSNRIYPVRYPLGKTAYILGLGIAIYVLSNLISEETLVTTLILKAFLVGIYPVLIIVTGVLEDKDINSAKAYLSKIGKKYSTIT